MLHEVGTTSGSTAPPRMRSLVDLLRTWQLWSYRDSLTHKIAEAREARDTDQVKTLTRRLAAAPAAIGPLEALAANHELASLLAGWQGHAIRAARKAGASWQQIAAATGATAEQACADCLAYIEHTNPNTDTSTTTHQPPGESADDTNRAHAPHQRSDQRTGQSPMTRHNPAEAIVVRAAPRRCG